MKTNVPRMAVVVLLLLLSGCRNGLFQSAETRRNQLTDSTLATYEQQRSDKAQALGDKSPQQRSIAENLSLGHEAAEQKRWREARSYYEAVLQVDPSHALAHHRLAFIADQDQPQPDFARAERHYLAALQQRPNDANLLNDLGYSYLLQERFDQSELYLRTALKSDKSHQLALRNLGLLYSKQGDYDSALEMFRLIGSEADAQAIMASLFPQGPPAGSGRSDTSPPADSPVEPFGSRPMGGGLAQSSGAATQNSSNPTMRQLMEEMELARSESLVSREQNGRRPELDLVPNAQWPEQSPQTAEQWPQTARASDPSRRRTNETWPNKFGNPGDDQYGELADQPAISPAGNLMTIEQMQAYENSTQRAPGTRQFDAGSGIPQITPANALAQGRSSADPLDSMPTWPENASNQMHASTEPGRSLDPLEQWPAANPTLTRDPLAAGSQRSVRPVGHQEPEVAGRFHQDRNLHADYQSFPTQPDRADQADYQAHNRFADSTGRQQQNGNDAARQAAVLGMGTLFPLVDRPADGRVTPAGGASRQASSQFGTSHRSQHSMPHPNSIAHFPVEHASRTPGVSATGVSQSVHRQPSDGYDRSYSAQPPRHDPSNVHDYAGQPMHRGQEPYGVHQPYDVHQTRPNPPSPHYQHEPQSSYGSQPQSAQPAGGTIPAADYSTVPFAGY
jgi:Flp pilus assembly protein TadD